MNFRKEKQKMNTNQNGITLIALVVTIVVLLILAGITINMLFSENGIITKAKEAAEKTEKAEKNEAEGMQNMVDQMDELINWKEGIIEVPKNPIETYDISANGDRSVLAYIVEREGETEKYDMLIIGNGEMTDNFEDRPYDDYMNAIVTVQISKGVTNVGAGLCGGFQGLESVVIPKTVTKIGEVAFSGSTITSVTINSPIISFEIQAFAGCANLTELTIKGDVKKIEASAFGGCSKLSNITIKSSVENIGQSAFAGSGLEELVINGSVGTIGTIAFGGCSKLSNITIKGSVENIGQSAFTGSGLEELVINGSVVSIGNTAFCGCGKMKSITIKKTVESIGEQAFAGCTNLETIIYEGTTVEWASVTLGTDWANGVKATTVQCSNGTVNI